MGSIALAQDNEYEFWECIGQCIGVEGGLCTYYDYKTGECRHDEVDDTLDLEDCMDDCNAYFPKG